MSKELDQLASLANAVKIDDELSAPKEWRSKGTTAGYEIDDSHFETVEPDEPEGAEIYDALPHPPRKARKTPVGTTAKSLITTIDGLTQLGRPWINAKIKKKLSEADWDRVYDLQEEDDSKASPEDMKLLERVARLKRESAEFAKELRFSQQDREDLLEATELMVEETGFDMPPSMPFFIEIVKKLGERAIMISTI